jgi:hypothetical protein
MPSPADKCLPFSRGDVADLSELSWDSTVLDELVGKKYWVEDTQHSTGELVCLRAVRAESELTVVRKFVAWGTDAKDFGRTVSGFDPTAGTPTKPIDDAYTAGDTIPANSIFFVVESGPCNVVTESSSVNLSAHDAVAADSAGCVNGAAAAAGETPVGVIDAASTDTDTNVLVHVYPGLQKAEAAG